MFFFSIILLLLLFFYYYNFYFVEFLFTSLLTLLPFTSILLIAIKLSERESIRVLFN